MMTAEAMQRAELSDAELVAEIGRRLGEGLVRLELSTRGEP